MYFLVYNRKGELFAFTQDLFELQAFQAEGYETESIDNIKDLVEALNPEIVVY